MYNPCGKDLLDVSITIATEYADDLDDTGVRLPTRFEQFDLQICSKTPDNLFYKARVLDDGYFDVYHHTKDFPEGRLYYVSTLTTSGQSVAVGEEFIYTGYAKGMNIDQVDSTLEARNRARNVLTVELQDTFYRMGQPDQEGEYTTQDTLHSVYFSLPNKTLLQYGYVDKIHGSYEEYKTLPIYILSEKDVYEQMLSVASSPLDGSGMEGRIEYKGSTPLVPWNRYYDEDLELAILSASDLYSFNLGCATSPLDGTFLGSPSDYTAFAPFVFYTGNYSDGFYGSSDDVDEDAVGTPKYASDYALKGSDLFAYICQYSISNPTRHLLHQTARPDLWQSYDEWKGEAVSHGFFPDKDAFLAVNTNINVQYAGQQVTLNPNLFQGRVDEGHTLGYQEFDIYAEDSFRLEAFEDVSTWWQAFWGNRQYEDLSQDVAGIVVITSADIEGMSDQDLSEAYYVNLSDVPELRDAISAAERKGESVHLFRFSVTDYTSVEASVFAPSAAGAHSYTGLLDDRCCTVSEGTVFFNFDILDISFRKDQKLTVLPVSTDPLTIIADGAKPLVEPTWTQILKDDFNAALDRFQGMLDDLGAEIKNILLTIAKVLGGVGIVLLFIRIIVFIIELSTNKRTVNRALKDYEKDKQRSKKKK